MSNLATAASLSYTTTFGSAPNVGVLSNINDGDTGTGYGMSGVAPIVVMGSDAGTMTWTYELASMAYITSITVYCDVVFSSGYIEIYNPYTSSWDRTDLVGTSPETINVNAYATSVRVSYTATWVPISGNQAAFRVVLLEGIITGELVTDASFRVSDGSNTYKLYADPLDASPLRIYGTKIFIGETTDPAATPLRVYDGSNVKSILGEVIP